MDRQPDDRTDTDTDADTGTGDDTEGDPEPAAGDVRRTYDRIATHFSKTREYPWPEVTTFLASGSLTAEDGPDAESAGAESTGDARTGGTAGDAPLERANVGLDVGCGNGRHADPLAERVGRVVGVDVSRGLLREARRRARDRGFDDRLRLAQADAAALPLASDAVDVAVYVATLHHLRPRARRVASLDELARVLAPGGRALVGVWSVAHDRFDATEGFDTTVDWTLPGGERVPRFYHVYDAEEFRADLATSGLAVRETTVSSGNCYAVVAAGGRVE